MSSSVQSQGSPPTKRDISRRRACQLLTSAGGKYSKFAKKQGREYKRKEDLESEWLGKEFGHAQQKTCYMAALQEATRLLKLYSAEPTSAAVPLLQCTVRLSLQLLRQRRHPQACAGST